MIFEGINSPNLCFFQSLDQFKEKLKKFIQMADLGITEIFLDKTEKIKQNRQEFFLKYPSLNNKAERLKSECLVDLKNYTFHKLEAENVHSYKILFQSELNEKKVNFSPDEISEGTKIFFKHIGVLLNIFRFGRILFIDEIERSLHPFLTKFIISLFKNSEINKNNAQLIFISHDVTLIDKEVMEKEQIYFTEKNEKTLQSALFSLVDFKTKPKKKEKFYQKYLAGKYGAFPQIKDFNEDNI